MVSSKCQTVAIVTHDTKQSKGKEAIKETKLSNGTEIRELVCVLSDIAITSAIDTAYIELLLADNCIVGSRRCGICVSP